MENNTKKCTKCLIIKDFSEFNKNKGKRDGLSCHCKECHRKDYLQNRERKIDRQKKIYRENKEKIAINSKKYRLANKEKLSEYIKEWRLKNKEKIREKSKKDRKENKREIKEKRKRYYDKNKEIIKDRNKKWRKENREKVNLRTRVRESVNIESKLRQRIRSRLRKAIDGKIKTGSTFDNLGCSIEYLKKYLESLFDSSMNWENYGYNGWHIDHIEPLCSFNLTDPKQLKKACHYSNLRPLWAKDNFKKAMEDKKKAR